METYTIEEWTELTNKHLKNFCRFIADDIMPHIYQHNQHHPQKWNALKKHVKKMEKKGFSFKSDKDKQIIENFINDPIQMLYNPPDLKENNTEILQSLYLFSQISDTIIDNLDLMASICKTIHILTNSNPAIPEKTLRKACIYVRLLSELYKQHPST